MARQFKILEKEYVKWLFVDPESHTPAGYVSYRLVIEHGLFDLLHNSGLTREQCKKCLMKIKEDFDSNRDYVENDAFLKLYQLHVGGVVLVDKTRWCYPLVLIDSRIFPLKKALKNIAEKIDLILNVLEQSGEWNIELQGKLSELHDIPPMQDRAA